MMEFLASIEDSAFSTFIRESGSVWAYPTILTLHTYGLGLLVGSHWALSLRVLGVAPRIPLGAMSRLYRWIWFGLTINVITGVVLLATEATTKTVQVVFWIKLVLVFSAVIVAVRMKSRLFPPGATEDDRPVPAGVRSLAVLSLVFWAGAIVAGRLMAYL